MTGVELRRGWHWAQVFALLGMIIGGVVSLGYVFRVQTLSYSKIYSSLGLHTALLFVIAGLGILLARPDRGVMAVLTSERVAGRLSRFVLPPIVLIPVAISWLILAGLTVGLYGAEFGFALNSLTNVVIFAFLIGVSAHRLNHLHDLVECTNRKNAFLATIVESSSDAILRQDLSGMVTSWSPGAERIYGYASAEMLGRPLAKLFSSERDEEEQQILTKIILGERVGLETVRKHKDGRLMDMSITVCPIVDEHGNVIGASNVGRDITELRRAEERLQLVVEAAPNAILMVNRDGQIVLVNSQTEEVFGYPSDELLGQRIEMLLPERFRSGHTGHRLAFLGDPESRPMGTGHHLNGLRRDGTELLLEISLSPIKTAEGMFVLAAVVDVSAHNQAEAALLKAGALQKAIFNSANFSCIATDAKGVIQIFNVGAERMLGYTATDVMNKITPADISDTQELIARAKALSIELETPIAPGFEALVFKASRAIEDIYELTYVRRDGSRFPAVVSVTALRDAQGVIIGYLLIGTDNTARKRLEERFRAIIEAAPTAMVMVDRAGCITLINGLTEMLFGYHRDELLGQIVEILLPERYRATHSELRDGFFCVPSAHRTGQGRELYGLRKDGSEFPVEIGLNPIETSEGVFVLSAIADITERKRAEEALRRRTEELARSNQDLEQFSYVASHDLQEPLRAVAGSLQLLQRRYQGQLDVRADEFIGHAVDGATRMQALIDDLLAYSRVGRQEDRHQLADCGKALDQALRNLNTAIQESGAQVSRGALPTLPAISAQLSLLFQNLVGNAIKFGRKDTPMRIHVGAEHRGNAWLFRVEDNGIGIDPQYFERIFLIFQRLHTRREYPGTGIGLALCKRIVEHHGGSIWIESKSGEGTTFFFTLLA
jgi:PAS domain S-box-containing protein